MDAVERAKAGHPGAPMGMADIAQVLWGDFLKYNPGHPEWVDRDEWRRAFEDLRKAGKVRFFGVSINDHQPDSALDLIRTGLIDTVQVIYNIYDQTAAQHLFPLCSEHNIGVIVRVPFDEGALTGRINEDTVFPAGDFRESYFAGDRKRQVREHNEALYRDLGIDEQALPSIALRFCLSDPAVSTVIPGMRSLSSVDVNTSVPGQGPLPPHALEVVKRHAWTKNFYSAD